MDYDKFDIIAVAEACGISLKTGRHNAEYMANCPFCRDTKHHLGINRDKEVFRCFRCGEKGNAVSLYAKIQGISNKEAYEALKNNDLVSERSFSPPPPKPEIPIRPLMERHNVYYDMLNMLHLEKTHRENLLSRGLQFSEIHRFMYKSIPTDSVFRKEVIRKLMTKYNLIGIPGFYRSSSGEIQMYVPKYSGIFVPYCDKDGYIQGLQIRLDLPNDSKDKKFRWFSTRDFDEGTKAQAWVHVVGDTTSKEAYLTEGAMKCDISSVLSGGRLLLAVPGVQSIGNLLQVISELGITRIYECFDMDKRSNPQVRSSLIKLRRLLYENGVECVNCSWNAKYKGLDDYYLAKSKAMMPIAA